MDIINRCWYCGNDESVLKEQHCKKGFTHLYMPYYKYEDGEPCSHPYCQNHVKSFCEVCLRKSCRGVAYVDAYRIKERFYYE